MTNGFDDAIDQSIIKPQSHIGMDTKCEVQDGTSFCHLDDISFWRIDKDIAIEQLYRERILKMIIALTCVGFL